MQILFIALVLALLAIVWVEANVNLNEANRANDRNAQSDANPQVADAGNARRNDKRAHGQQAGPQSSDFQQQQRQPQSSNPQQQQQQRSSQESDIGINEANRARGLSEREHSDVNPSEQRSQEMRDKFQDAKSNFNQGQYSQAAKDLGSSASAAMNKGKEDIKSAYDKTKEKLSSNTGTNQQRQQV